MKKKAIAIAAILTVCALAMAACGGSGGGNLISSAGQSTLLEGVKKAPAELNPYSVAYAYMAKQRDFSSYTLTTTGSTTAKKGIVSYTQTIKNTTIKNGDEYFQQAESDSMFVKMKHQVFVKEGKAVYRGGLSGELNVSERSAYKELYGVSPDDIGINGFILNETSVKYAERVSEEDGAYTYRFVLDGEAAGANAKKQMKQFGSLNDYPVFSELTLLLTVKNDWTPVTLVTECTYDISIAVLGNMTCTQKLESTFSDVNGSVTIPDAKSFNEKIGTTPSVVVPGESDKSALMQVVEAMAGYDYEQGMHFGLSLDIGLLGFPMPSTADLYITYDPQAVKNGDYLNAVRFRLDADLSQMLLMSMIIPMINPDLSEVAETVNAATVMYIGDGNLYMLLKQVTEQSETIIAAQTLDLGTLVKPLLGLINPNVDPVTLFAQAEDAFDTTKTETGYMLSLKPDLLAALNAAYGGLIQTVKTSAGAFGSIVEAMIGGTFTAGELTIDMDEGAFKELSFALKAVMNSSEDGSAITFAQVGFSVKGPMETGELDGDRQGIEAILANDEAAASVRGEIKVLEEHMWLHETFLTRVRSVTARYEALTDAQKALVFNAHLLGAETKYGTLMYTYNDAVKRADEFIKKIETIESWTDGEWTTNNTLFSYMTEEQVEYLGDHATYYLETRYTHEKSVVTSLNTELAAMTAPEAGGEFEALKKFMLLYNQYLSMSERSKADVTGLDEVLESVFTANIDPVIAAFDDAIAAINGVSETPSIDELLEAYKMVDDAHAWFNYDTWMNKAPESFNTAFQPVKEKQSEVYALCSKQFTVGAVEAYKEGVNVLVAQTTDGLTAEQLAALKVQVANLQSLYGRISHYNFGLAMELSAEKEALQEFAVKLTPAE